MLRNVSLGGRNLAVRPILNEVLSLNAQESCSRLYMFGIRLLLNEVLSLNAQE